ncbi:MAG: helix-turn-helix transcriptional regulator [Opitutales bacterium]
MAESFAQGQVYSCTDNESGVLFERSVPIEWAGRTIALRGERVSLRPGIELATSRLSGQAKGRHPVDLDPEAVHLLAINEGTLKLSLPDLGMQCLRAGDWCLLAADQATVHVASGQNCDFSIVRCAASVFCSLVAMAELPGQSLLHCLSCPQSMKPLFRHGPSSERLAKLARVMGVRNTGGLSERLFVEVHCLKWIGELILLPEFSAGSEERAACSEREASCLREVAAYLETHLDAEHSLKDLSRRFHLNECKLKRGFKQVYGQTVFGYLRECRMRRAEGRLRTSDDSVLEIACEVGYSNASYFARSFNERFGMLPKAYQCLHAATRRAALSSGERNG